MRRLDGDEAVAQENGDGEQSAAPRPRRLAPGPLTGVPATGGAGDAQSTGVSADGASPSLSRWPYIPAARCSDSG